MSARPLIHHACPRCLSDLRPVGRQKLCDFCGYLTPAPAAAEPTSGPPVLLAGLDLGQLQDYTALVLASRVPTPEGPRYDVTTLHRWELGTSYPQMVREAAKWLNEPARRKAKLIVDQTGVGVAVVDLFREAPGLGNRLVPVTITAGRSASLQPDGSWHVAKIELASSLQAVFSSRRLQLAPSLPLAPIAAKELKAFTAKPTPKGSETFESWREKDHDDLVLALALLLWYGEHGSTAQVIPLL